MHSIDKQVFISFYYVKNGGKLYCQGHGKTSSMMLFTKYGPLRQMGNDRY